MKKQQTTEVAALVDNPQVFPELSYDGHSTKFTLQVLNANDPFPNKMHNAGTKACGIDAGTPASFLLSPQKQKPTHVIHSLVPA